MAGFIWLSIGNLTVRHIDSLLKPAMRDFSYRSLSLR